MRKPSFALENFKKSMLISDTLLNREKRYKDPPKIKNFNIIKGLRGAVLVLMVASFENFLKEVMEERLNELSASPKFKFNSLPLDIKHYNHRQTFYHSLKPPIKLDTAQKISNFEQASQLIANQKINPEAYSIAIRSNPNSERLSNFFSSIGYSKFFSRIEPKFEKRIGRPIDVQYTLDSIIRQRNQIAHSFTHAITLSRYELHEHNLFLKTLSDICDDELFTKIRSLDK